jgi:holo-[acyl-carrier protein] synthase
MSRPKRGPGRTGTDGRPEAVRSGVDVEAISSFRTLDPRVAERVKRRVFTEAERAYCEGARFPAQHYAVRWAAKEAFVKLVGGMDRFAYDGVEVARGPDGPWLELSDAALRALGRALDRDPGAVAVDLSLSHDRDLDAGVAQLVAYREGPRV